MSGGLRCGMSGGFRCGGNCLRDYYGVRRCIVSAPPYAGLWGAHSSAKTHASSCSCVVRDNVGLITEGAQLGCGVLDSPLE